VGPGSTLYFLGRYILDKSILDRIEKVLEKEAQDEGLTLVKLSFIPNGENGPTLEVLIDHDFNITMDEIVRFTDRVSPLLDGIDEIADSYVLDICSGGSERELTPEDVKRFLGQYLDITLKKDDERITALIDKADDEKMSGYYFIKGRKKKVEVRYDECSSIRMGYKA